MFCLNSTLISLTLTNHFTPQFTCTFLFFHLTLLLPFFFVSQALADESEFVRDTALRAGQRIINLYAKTAVNVFLPELEKGLFDDNWRIRYSSVQLLGDLLYRISGVTGKMTTVGDDDDNFGTEHSTKVGIQADEINLFVMNLSTFPLLSGIIGNLILSYCLLTKYIFSVAKKNIEWKLRGK